MSYSWFRERPLVVCSLPFLILFGSCNAQPQCDSFENRNAVIQTVSDDHSNPLAAFAAKNSTHNNDGAAPSNGEPAKSTGSEDKKPLYLLGEKIVTTSTSQDKQTLGCSGSISVTIGDTKASKEVNFTVQQSSNGKLSVSVAPFQF
jgi:hypothetical protein